MAEREGTGAAGVVAEVTWEQTSGLSNLAAPNALTHNPAPRHAGVGQTGGLSPRRNASGHP
jgi:hypothetical protein